MTQKLEQVHQEQLKSLVESTFLRKRNCKKSSWKNTKGNYMREGKKVGKKRRGHQSSGAPQVPINKGDFEKPEGVSAHLN